MFRFAQLKRRFPGGDSRMVVPESSHLQDISTLANRAFRQAARIAMERSGFVVVAEDEWVVRKYPDGRIERISPLPKVKRPEKLVL